MLSLKFKNNEFVHDFISNGVLGINIELMVDPATMQLAQGIAKLSFNVTLCVGLFCGQVQFFEDFTLCDLDKFDVSLVNTFLDVYKVDILCNRSKLRVHAKVGSKLVNLNLEYNFALAEVGVNSVVLVNKL